MNGSPLGHFLCQNLFRRYNWDMQNSKSKMRQTKPRTEAARNKLVVSVVAVVIVMQCQYSISHACPGSFLLATQTVESGEQSLNSADDEVTQAEIDRLVRQLGAPSYAARQSAIEQLWELGPKAKSSLEQAVAGTDSEVARRAGEILTVLSMGIDKSGSPETAKLILHFHSSEQSVRIAVLLRLFNSGKIHLAFELMGQIEDLESQADLFDTVISFEDKLIQLAREDNWEDFEFILSHPITFAHRPDAAVHYHLLNGTLGEKTEAIELSIKSKEDDGKKLDDNELKKLVAIYRFTDQYELAFQYAEKIKDADFQAGMETQLIKEQGDWAKLAQRMAISEEEIKPGEKKLVCAPAQQALVHHYLGDLESYRETVKSLEEKAKEFEQDKDESEAKSLRETLIQIGLSNLDWDLVVDNLQPDEKTRSFWIHSTNNRAEGAFKVIGLGESVEERTLWIDRRLRYYRSLALKSKRLYESGDDTDEVDERKQEVWSNTIAVAGLLGDLGHRDVSIMFFQTLFASLELENQNYTRFAIIASLIELECYDTAWELIEYGIDSNAYRSLLTYILPTRSSSARFWFGQLKTRYSNPLQRLKVTSGIVNSPLGTTKDFDLNVELAAALSNLKSSSATEFQLAKVYEYHGQFERSENHFAAARDLGYRTASQDLAYDAMKRGNYELALAYFEETWRSRNSAFDAAFAAEAFRKSEKPQEAKLRQCLAFALWNDSYRTSSTVVALDKLESTHLIKDFLAMETIDMFGNQISSEGYRDELAKAVKTEDPERSAINFQVALFAAMADGLDSQITGYWSDTRKKINLAVAKTKIAAGQSDAAYKLVEQYNRFCPGDPDLAEEAVVLLDKAGERELADQLFDELTRHYVSLLATYPDSSTQHNNYAWACAVARRGSDIMLRHALRACEIRPNSSSSLDTLAEVYFLRGDRTKAIELSERCIQLNPTKQHYRKQLIRFKSETPDKD